MSAATQLRRTAAHRPTEVGGASRPQVATPLRPATTAGATVLPFRPAVDVGSLLTTDPESGLIAGPDPGSHPEPPAPGRGTSSAQSPPVADTPCPGPPADLFADAETVRRISGIARSVAQGALEVLGGVRPLQQMACWLDPENYERLQLRANLVRCIGSAHPARTSRPGGSSLRQVRVRSARVCPVAPGVFEASVVAFDQIRIRAVALRIEQRRGVWRVTALEIG